LEALAGKERKCPPEHEFDVLADFDAEGTR
jgi:hypothetical protein